MPRAPAVRRQAWTCLFEPLTHCDIPRGPRFGTPYPHRIHRPNDMPDWRIVTTNFVMSRRMLWGDFAQNPPLDSPQFVRHNAALLAFLFRPVPRIVAHKERLWQWLRLTTGAGAPGFTAVHVRLTDKVPSLPPHDLACSPTPPTPVGTVPGWNLECVVKH